MADCWLIETEWIEFRRGESEEGSEGWRELKLIMEEEEEEEVWSLPGRPATADQPECSSERGCDG